MLDIFFINFHFSAWIKLRFTAVQLPVAFRFYFFKVKS